MAGADWNYPTPPGGSASIGGETHRTGGPMPNQGGRWTDGREPGQPTEQAVVSTDAGLDLAAVETELEQLRALRRTDARAYWKEENQQREASLIRQQLALKAAPAKTQNETAKAEAEAETEEQAAGDSELARIVAELGEIKKTRREAPKRYDAEGMEAREMELLDRREILEAGAGDMAPELIERWRREGGLKVNMERAQAVAARAGAEFAGIAEIVDALPSEAAVAITDALRLDYPVVRGSEEHRLAVADQRLGAILSMLPDKVADDAEARLRAMTKAQLQAIRRVLVG